MAENDAGKPAPVKLVPVIVGRGRTLIDADGEHGPGETVKIAADEAEKLLKLGHVLDPKVIAASLVTALPDDPNRLAVA
jgi:hypothetical protein